jgi:putative DNA primase/helicase
VIAEGLEDALSIARTAVAHAVIGLPGVGRFGQFDLPCGANVVIFKDGDDAGTEAAKDLTAAVDRWLLGGARVRVTATPEGADANSILRDRGAEELRRLLADAQPAALSFDADVVRLAGLELVGYERERTAAAQRHRVRVAFLDAAVKAARADADAASAEEDEDEALDPEPVTDLGPVLDQAFAELHRHVVVSEPELAAAVLWAVHTHLVHHEQVRLPVSPKLAIQSPDKGCGKSTLLEAIGALVPRPETGSSITAAATFRLIEARRPSLLIDEADRVLRGSSDELIAVLNSSHRRSGAYVWRVEEIHGERVPCKFSTWAAVAFAGIKALPATLQDRSIVIRLARAKPGEVKAHLRNGTSPALTMLKRKFARWAADLVRLPEPQLPAGLHNRTGDNWLPLFAIATAAGGRWPAFVEQAALSAVSADQQESELVALLDGIRRAFAERDRLRTRELLDILLADDEYDWGVANRGEPINDAWLRERLRNVIAPAADGKPGSERWGSRDNKERGYSRRRFEDAWARYLRPFETTPNHPAHPAHPAPPLKNQENSGPDEPRHTRPPSNNTRSRVRRNGGGPDAKSAGAGCETPHPAPKKLTKTKAGPGGPDGPGVSGPNAKGMPLANGQLGDEELL